jgi:chromosome partitioning protein
MYKIMVANPKGGCGKSTLAVHLASWFARADEVVYLGDLDRQQSSRQWLEQRPENLPRIRHWQIDPDEFSAPPKECSVAILDTPAGLHGKALKRLLNEVDRVLVPVSPSRFDMLASRDFFEELAATKALRKDRVGVGIVGMRIDARTQASQRLLDFLQQFELPLVTCISAAQRYVNAIETSLTLFDARGEAAEQGQWQPLFEWLSTRR